MKTKGLLLTLAALGFAAVLMNAEPAFGRDGDRDRGGYSRGDGDRDRGGDRDHGDRDRHRGGYHGYYAHRPVYYGPRPVYYYPRPAYYAPAPVYYYPRPVYVAPAPVVVERPVYVAPPSRGVSFFFDF